MYYNNKQKGHSDYNLSNLSKQLLLYHLSHDTVHGLPDSIIGNTYDGFDLLQSYNMPLHSHALTCKSRTNSQKLLNQVCSSDLS